MTLSLYNTLTRQKEAFAPMDANNVRMYVCGPTVYDRPHIGNARSVVVYDVLYRLLCHLYDKNHVTYVRNITDVDDKINARAKELGLSIQKLTAEITQQFHDDMGALHVLPPTQEPRATNHIAQMIAMISTLITNQHAYVSQGHVLFAVDSYKDYGALSGRKLDELMAGARVEVESYKKHPGDFVLWKPADAGDDPSSVFDSPWGKGRPGWHIECSAMSGEYLGATFDIHGGGSDLMFPHHENEIAQSRCADETAQFAKYWVHNGFLTVNGEKMSKSLGNFITVKDLLDKGVKGEVIRYALLSTKYNEPLDWSEKLLEDAKKTLDKWYRIKDVEMGRYGDGEKKNATTIPTSPHPPIPTSFLNALCNDLNFPKAFSIMHYAKPEELMAMAELMGLLKENPKQWMQGEGAENVQSLIDARVTAKKTKNWPEADRIRKILSDQGIILEDRPDGTTDWRRV
jgi:cysteinyl-tRNA synthetase